jgi:protoporphyrinogen oxidase
LNRRSFLTKLARLGALFGSGSLAQLLGGERFALAQTTVARGGSAATELGQPDAGYLTLELSGHGYQVDPWTGDDFLLGHRLRDSEIPDSKVVYQRSCDFVVVGGGLAGMTAAYHLRDEDVLLLEQYSHCGGQSRGDSFKGVDFCYGSYVSGTGDSITHELLGMLGLQPVVLGTNCNSWHDGERHFVGLPSDSRDRLYKDFASFRNIAEPIWKSISVAGKDENLTLSLMKDSSLSGLDAVSFSSCLHSYSREFLEFVDAFCRSRSCLDAERISALAGYQLIQELFVETGTFRGGNSAIVRALQKNLPREKYSTDCFVWSVAVIESGVEVLYSDRAGNLNRVLAKQAIIAVPLLVAARIIKHVDNTSKSAMLGFHYGSYLVANLLLSREAFQGTFDNFFYRASGFTEMVVADTVYRADGVYAPHMGRVLTVYRPYAPGSEGRAVLLEGRRKDFASEIAQQVSMISDKIEASLERIVLSRWGHAMPVMGKGYYSKMSKTASINYPNLILAHSSIQGRPCADSAIRAGRTAAKQALKSSS